ncbi:MAG: hypothetical protein QNJ54_36830 [Prochloraceae cyanobacterium]|nr:hypothetical protein [Prochloraceae cyanobacterium]
MEHGVPLVWNQEGKAVKVDKIPGTRLGSGSFNLNDWSTASGGSWEYWSTDGTTDGFTGPPLIPQINR